MRENGLGKGMSDDSCKFNREEFHLSRYSKHNDLDLYMDSEMSKKFGNRFIEYRENWKKANEQAFVPEFPLMLGIELTDTCNYHCIFCYRRDNRGSDAKLGFDTFKKIIDEGSGFNLPCVGFGAGAEVMMEPDVMKMVQYCTEKEIIDIFFSTNGSMLSFRDIDALIDMEVSRLMVSIDAATPETYRLVRGGDLLHVEKMIHYCYKRREKLGKVFPIIRLSFVYHELNKHEVQTFLINGKRWLI